MCYKGNNLERGFVMISATWVLLWLFFALIGWAIGSLKDRGIEGLLWSAFFGPLGWLIILIVTSSPSPKTTVVCVSCGHRVGRREPTCRYCGFDFRRNPLDTKFSGD